MTIEKIVDRIQAQATNPDYNPEGWYHSQIVGRYDLYMITDAVITYKTAFDFIFPKPRHSNDPELRKVGILITDDVVFNLMSVQAELIDKKAEDRLIETVTHIINQLSFIRRAVQSKAYGAKND